jgi:hypothetical protein
MDSQPSNNRSRPSASVKNRNKVEAKRRIMGVTVVKHAIEAPVCLSRHVFGDIRNADDMFSVFRPRTTKQEAYKDIKEALLKHQVDPHSFRRDWKAVQSMVKRLCNLALSYEMSSSGEHAPSFAASVPYDIPLDFDRFKSRTDKTRYPSLRCPGRP